MTDVGLRELKKNKLRQTVQREALRLFVERSYEQTTVEQIAEAAEISTTTFYRYYPGKEDILLLGDYDPQPLGDVLASRPADESLAVALQATLQQAMGIMLEFDRDDLLQRLRFVYRIPELRACLERQRHERLEEFAAMLARRAGVDPDAYTPWLAAAVISAGLVEAVRYWVERDGEPDLMGLVDEFLRGIAPLLSMGESS